MADDCIVQAMALKGRSFEFERKRYDVTDVRYAHTKTTIYTVQERTFVKDTGQLMNFMRQIKTIDVEPENEPKEEIMSTTLTPVQTEAQASVTVASQMTAELKKMFDVLAGTPTEEDYKKAEAMSKVVHTIVSVEQTKINFLKLKDRV